MEMGKAPGYLGHRRALGGDLADESQIFHFHFHLHFHLNLNLNLNLNFHFSARGQGDKVDPWTHHPNSACRLGLEKHPNLDLGDGCASPLEELALIS